jgi:acetyl esterase/lipase
VRWRAKEWGLDPGRVGILGFSAGGHLAAVASTHFETPAYEAVDAADYQSRRPDFTLLVYPAYLTTDDLTKLALDITVTEKTPPAFIVQTQDDTVHVENAYLYGLALKNARVAAELHLYPTGGHGYGLRPSGNAVAQWPQRAAEWLAAQGWLSAK